MKPLGIKEPVYQQAITLADISRCGGNPEWKQVFVTLAEEAAPQYKQILMDLSLVCNQAILDLSWSQLNDVD